MDFNAYDYFEKAVSTDLTLVGLQENGFKVDFNQEKRCMSVVTSKEGPRVLRKLVSVLTGYFSSQYNSVHRSGIVINEKGVVLTGKSGAGKTRVSNLFPESKVLDDDLLIVDREKMYVVGKSGGQSVWEDGVKRTNYLTPSDTIKEHSLDYIFLLDYSKPPGYLESKGNAIPTQYSTHGFVSTHLPQLSFLSKEIPINSPVYILGTNGDEQAIKERILEVIS